jgi:hypothetical protein
MLSNQSFKLFSSISPLVLTLFAVNVHAYETPTHAAITKTARDRSVVSQTSPFMKELAPMTSAVPAGLSAAQQFNQELTL